MTIQNYIKKLNALFKRAILKRDTSCRVCSRRPALTVHHVLTQGSTRNAGRWEKRNAIGICDRCHAEAHGLNADRRAEIEGQIKSFMEKTYGQSWETDLYNIVNKPLKIYDFEDKEQELRAEIGGWS